MSTVDNLSLDLVKLISSYVPKFVYTFYYKDDIYVSKDKEECIKELVSRMKKYNIIWSGRLYRHSEDLKEEYYLKEENENETLVIVRKEEFRFSSTHSIFRKNLN